MGRHMKKMDMPEKTTQDYESPDMVSRVTPVLSMSLMDVRKAGIAESISKRPGPPSEGWKCKPGSSCSGCLIGSASFA